MATHLAAVSVAKGQPLELQTRRTPRPGPGELLIAVRSIALNPADAIMRDQGVLMSKYPTVVGFDISGLVLEIGDDVPTGNDDNGSELCFRPGLTRVAAYAAAAWKGCDPDYGAFQERCLVPWQHAVPLPDEGISWNHAATLPVAVEVALNAWDAIGIPRIGEASIADVTTDDRVQKNEAILIWGASSSVGTMGVQTARLMQEHPASPFAAVYATAGSANTSYISSLGADRVFDYTSPDVVDAIVAAAKSDGVVIRHCFLAIGQLSLCQAVLKAFVGDHREGSKTHIAKIGSAPRIPPDAEDVEEIDAIFVVPSAVEEERLEQFHYWIGTWLRTNLVNKTITPSPAPTIIGKGIGSINAGIDKLLEGVSCTKLIVELAE